MKAKLLFTIILIASLISFGGCENKEIEIDNTSNVSEKADFSNYYLIEMISDEYILDLLDNNGDVIYTIKYPKEVVVNYEAEGILNLSISTGSTNSYVQYYNYLTGELSEDIYTNPLEFEYNQVVFMMDRVLVVKNVFTDQILAEIERDFSVTAVPASTIGNVEFISQNEIQVEYLSGDDYELVKENIKFSK